MFLRTVTAVLCALVITSGSVAFAQSLPSGWSTADIGSVGATGSAQGSGSSFTANGAGADVWGSADAFRFVYTTLAGDGSVVAQVSTLENVNAWTKAGVMMRDTLSAGSRHAFALVSPGKGLAFQRRTATGGTSTNTAGGSGVAPYYLRLTRAGSNFTAEKSTNGSSWTTIGSATISMNATIYVGLVVSSHVAGNLATATFASTAVTKASTSVTPTGTTMSTLRVLHWNTHHGGTRTDNVYDPTGFAGYIAQYNPDVVSLNEVETQAQVDAIVSALRSKTGKTWATSWDGRGNVVLSKLSTTNDSICMVNASADRKSAHLSLLVNGKPLNVWSAHLALDSSAVRQTEVNALQACALQWAEARIVAGDFNTQSDTAEIKDMSATYYDAWPTAKSLGTAANYSDNCDGCTRNSRIDYVFSSRTATMLSLKSAQIFDTRNSSGVMPSDHKPMLVIYNLR